MQYILIENLFENVETSIYFSKNMVKVDKFDLEQSLMNSNLEQSSTQNSH